MRRTGPSVLAQGVVALAVLAGGIVVVVARGSTPVASAETVLGTSTHVRIVTSSGAAVPVVAGQRLADGDLIMTGPHGSAELITRHRLTLLGSAAALVVTNGARQELRSGTAVIDAQHGPRLDLKVSGDLVSIPHGSATEAERGVSVRVGALTGPAAITSNIGRRLALPALSQAVLSGDALPGGTTPLHLTDSVDEDRVAHRLVADDLALKTLARGIDTTGHSTAHVVESSWTGATQALPNRAKRSERVLPVLIADSTHGGTAQQRYNSAVVWRSEGGSWGVVLHLLAGHAATVESTLAALQRKGQTPGQIGTVPAGGAISAAGPGPTVAATPPTKHHHHGPAPSGAGSPPSAPSGGGGGTGPTPPDTLVGGLVATVQNVIDGVLGLLPHNKALKQPATTTTGTVAKPLKSSSGNKPSSSGSTSTKRTTPKPPTPAPAPTAPANDGLLGNLLGGLLHR
ncbi:MAG TPA: hypothetical protein VG650_12010 [Mycobacteriales bacterium]|nr:hypothetical protein [Mycobacteriales bacterium]